jgi:hypothetical protein
VAYATLDDGDGEGYGTGEAIGARCWVEYEADDA